VKNIAVFCSGNGTNLQALIDAIRQKRLLADLVVVLSDAPRAYALTRAKKAGIPYEVLEPRRYPSRARYDAALLKTLQSYQPDVIVLAGFMRILSRRIVRKYRHKILNIHPALLPSFPGRHAVEDALTHGVKVTGVTVHLVDEGVDTGPIIFQESLPIRPGDTKQTLHARIHRIEHRLYPKAVRLLLQKKFRIVGRKVKVIR